MFAVTAYLTLATGTDGSKGFNFRGENDVCTPDPAPLRASVSPARSSPQQPHDLDVLAPAFRRRIASFVAGIWVGAVVQ